MKKAQKPTKRGEKVALLHREYTAVFQKSGKWIIAWIEEMPGVLTQGKTMKEARANVRDALMLMLEERQEAARRESRLTREIISVSVPPVMAV